MTRLQSKFSSHLPVICEAVDGTTDLRTNQKLYKKIYKYYKDMGVIFTGDSNTDYSTILDCLYEDIV
jgi:hypothetical protein